MAVQGIHTGGGAHSLSSDLFLGRIFFGASVFADLSAISVWVAHWFGWDSDYVLGVLFLSILVAAVILARKFVIPIRYSVGLFLLGVVLALGLWSWLANTPVRPVQVDITNLKPNMPIEGYRGVVQGHVGDPHASVRVLVRPLAIGEIWVQDIPIVDVNGDWRVNAYFGTLNEGIGQEYEVIALAVSDNFLVTRATGNALPVGKIDDTTIPRNTNFSTAVIVKRTH